MDFIAIISQFDWFYAGFIFIARVTDVSLGTLRTIAIVHGRTVMAFCLGFIESIIWLAVVSTIITTVKEQPMLGVIYALGFASGNLVGIQIERLIALGHLTLRVISRKNSTAIVEAIRSKGFPVTTFTGEGRAGVVLELYIVCKRRDLKKLLSTVLELDPQAFYVTEQTGAVSNIVRPIMQPATGWRAIIKKK